MTQNPLSPTLLLDTPKEQDDFIFYLLDKSESHGIIITVGVLKTKYKPTDFQFTDSAITRLTECNLGIKDGKWIHTAPYCPEAEGIIIDTTKPKTKPTPYLGIKKFLSH